MIPPLTLPDKILSELGIETPEDIDIEAIAMACGAIVDYRTLDGSDARIIGQDNEAIITIPANGMIERQRFSIAHELGHWMRDRGKVSFSCEENGFLKGWSEEHPEVRANRFASDLLLPRFMVQERTRGLQLTWSNVKALAAVFKTSLTATAIRLVEIGDRPGMIVCTNPQKREWFARHKKLVPDVFWPHNQPKLGSLALEIHKSGERQRFGTVDADAWIDRDDSHEHVLYEDSIRVSSDTVLSLIEWRNESQLVRFFRRSN